MELARRDPVADPDRPVGEDVDADPRAVDEAAEDARPRESLHVDARLVESLRVAADLADREGAADERVQVDAARDHVAARLFPAQRDAVALQVLERLGRDEREVEALARAPAEGAAVQRVAIAFEAPSRERAHGVDYG